MGRETVFSRDLWREDYSIMTNSTTHYNSNSLYNSTKLCSTNIDFGKEKNKGVIVKRSTLQRLQRELILNLAVFLAVMYKLRKAFFGNVRPFLPM